MRPGAARSIALLAALFATAPALADPVPFVGCPSVGQSGPLDPPAPHATPPVPAAASRHLALYDSGTLSVLAPRGWHCFGSYGSGGASLLVTPQAYTPETLPGFNTLSGPAVEVMLLNGENSGRTDVARVLSRLFPRERAFIRQAAQNDDVPGFPRGPFPSDRVWTRSSSTVDYTTPPHRTGMGTFNSTLRPGPVPITGRATLHRWDGVDSVVLLDARLSPEHQPLLPTILRSGRKTP